MKRKDGQRIRKESAGSTRRRRTNGMGENSEKTAKLKAGEQKRPRHELALKQQPGKTREQSMAEYVAAGVITNAASAFTWAYNSLADLDATELLEAVQRSVQRVNAGDLSEAEGMLMAQAIHLNTLFVTLADRANRNQELNQYEMNLKLALRTQSQCRATLETLSVLKNPPVFARQANIAHGPQQVNNGPVANGVARAGQHEGQPTKLLSGETIDAEQVDGGAASEAAGGDSPVETVGAVHRAANGRREGAGVPKPVPRR